MRLTVFRELPGVAAIEHQLDMQFRDRLLDDDVEELPHLIDDTSIALFGITQRDTFYWALPHPMRDEYAWDEWESRFDILWQHSRDSNNDWRAFDLDIRCAEGSPLRCLEVFGRQLVCALHGLHPHATVAFAERETSAKS